MRRIALVLVLASACASPRPARRAAPPTPVSASPPASPRTLPASRVAAHNARVELAREDGAMATWVDIAIDGPDARARALCELAVAEQLRVRAALPDARVARACDAAALPPIPARDGAVVLIAPTVFDEDAAALAIATAPAARTVFAHGSPATGTVTRYTRFADAASCTRFAERVRAARADGDRDSAAHAHAFLTDQLARTRADERAACDEATRAAAACAQRPAAERPSCDVEATARARACDTARMRITLLERRASAPPPPPPRADLRCVAE